MTKKIQIKKLEKCAAPSEFIGVVAFQVVQFTINYFGNAIECVHDTKIMQDGRQFVVGGDGFIPDGFEVIE